MNLTIPKVRRWVKRALKDNNLSHAEIESIEWLGVRCKERWLGSRHFRIARVVLYFPGDNRRVYKTATLYDDNGFMLQ